MTRRSHRLAASLTELAVAAPQVVTHRLTRMAAAGPAPGPRDRREFQRMSHEKVAAFWESWAAMARQTLATQQRTLLSMQAALWRACWTPFAAPRPGTLLGASAAQWQQRWQGAALDVLAHGLAPVHRRAVANSKRLGGVKRRR